MGKPQPPPEGVLLTRVREAASVSKAEAARRAGISEERWGQVEQGYTTRGGKIRPSRARAGLLARMAAAFDVPPERLETEGERPDAAKVLREILRGQPAPASDVDAALLGPEYRDYTPEERASARRWILFQRAEREREERERNRRGA